MPIDGLIDGVRTTWTLLWKQRAGRIVFGLFVVLMTVYLFELGPDHLRGRLSAHLDRLLLPGMICLLIVRTRSVEGVEERRFWSFLIGAMSIWLAGSVVFWFSGLVEMPTWVDLGVDVCFILLYLLLFLASDQQPQLPSGWSTRDVVLRFTIVGSTVFIALMFGYFVVVPWVLQPVEYLRYFASFNLYVTLDILLTIKFGLLFFATSSPRWRRCFALIASMTAVMATGDLIEGLGFADLIDAVMGERIDALWVVQHFLLAMMIVVCTGKASIAGGASRERHSRVQSLLPFYAFSLPVVHLGLYFFGYLDPDVRGPREAMVLGGLLFFGILSLYQQVKLESAVASLRADLTVRALDDKLRQSQRLEAIGRLAGGIAHDFNNLLMVIKGYTGLARQETSVGESGVVEKLGEIDAAADRAADLIRQLLAYGRRQVLRPEVVHVGEMVKGLEDMLARLIGDDIELTVEVDVSAGFARVDPALMEQVIVNLVVNGRDAMPRGGTMSIRTRSAVNPSGGLPGDPGDGAVVELTVTDTGVGIDPDVCDRIFEPYFTTKELGKGTGLGLATVYGIVEQSGGTIEVESELGRGSTFRVLLPTVQHREEAPPAPKPTSDRPLIGRTVLVTEDEKHIRGAVTEFLDKLGMKVLQAENGIDALEVVGRHDGEIDVLVTDLVMPRMSGPELARRLLAERRGLKVIYVSGYAPETMDEYGVDGDAAVFLQKPFLLEELVATIGGVLDD